MDPGYEEPVSVDHELVSINHEESDRGRFSQWSVDETRGLLMIRTELDPTFMENKRNNGLWEVISTRMTEMGYKRTPQQCKCKWKNLVTKYKGCETMLQAEGSRQLEFPFLKEMQIIFNARMQRMEAGQGGGGAATSKQKAAVQLSEGENGNGRAKKKMKRSIHVNGIKEKLEEFMKQQMEMEMESLKAYEEREEARKMKEKEWRKKMEELEIQRLSMNKRFMETEEERKIKEEDRSEKRDALVTILLNKFRGQCR